MEVIEEGQFSDAEEENKVYISNIIKKPVFLTDSNMQLEEEVTNLKIKDIESNDEYYCNSDDYDYDLDVKDFKQKTIIKTNLQNSNLQNISTKVISYQPKHDLLSRYINKINLGKYEGPTLSAHVANELIKNNRHVDRDRLRVRDKSDHATNENVLDSRIKRKLHKLFDKEILAEINGCISTGKEANIYYAKSIKGDEIAIKIYRTSILTFKNREKYIRGEYRFQHVYSLHNPRKMVKIWAEKEFCNLKRLEQANIRAPQPILYSGDHILLMEFLGSDGWAAPKLKDVTLTVSRAGILYRECVEIMWKMYNKCRLIHADLSEYNMLYLDGSIAIIDVSQAVDRDHFNATEFLRNDCSNITTFFKKHNVDVMSLQELFHFITDPTINENNMDEYLEMQMKETKEENDSQWQVKEAVFKQAYIPQKLTEVINAERDIKLAKSGKEDLIYKTLIGLKADLSKPAETPEILANKYKQGNGDMKIENDSFENTADSNSEINSEIESENENKSKFVNSARPRNESPESKKARKKAVKENQAEKRKTKIKKHMKKRKVKMSKQK